MDDYSGENHDGLDCIDSDYSGLNNFIGFDICPITHLPVPADEYVVSPYYNPTLLRHQTNFDVDRLFSDDTIETHSNHSSKTKSRKTHIEPIFSLTEQQNPPSGALYRMTADSGNYAHIRAKRKQNTISALLCLDFLSERKTRKVFDGAGLILMFFISLLCIYFF